jgi:hypothetical protein
MRPTTPTPPPRKVCEEQHRRKEWKLQIVKTERFRRRVAGISLIGFAATLLAQDVVGPRTPSDAAGTYAAVAADRGGMVVSSVLLLASSLALVPAVFGILHVLRERGVTLGHIGGVLAIVGALGHIAVMTYQLALVEMTKAGDREAMVALIERLDSSPVVGAIVLPMILSFALGLLILAVALWRARFVRGWAAALVLVAVLLDVGAPDGGPAAVSITKQLLAFAAFAYIGLQMLRMSDAEWDGLPEPAIDDKRVVATAVPA